MGKARIVSGGSGGLYTVEVKYDTTRIDARLADIAATLPVIQAELDTLDTQLTTSRAELTAAVAAMNTQINLINANKPFDGAYIDGLIDAMQDATGAVENKNIEIDDAYQTLNGYESAIDAATQDETAKRAAYQQAQAALSAYIAETGDTSSGLYLSQVADVENKLAAYQDAQQITVDTKTTFEPQIATQKAEIETLKTELKTLQADYKTINAEFVAVTQAMEAWSKQDQGAIDEAGKTTIHANAAYVLTKFKRDEKKREVTELTQEQKWLNKAKTQSSETRQAWCADYTTNIAANTEVGTIEIAQEQADIPMLIYPGYAENTYIDSGFTPLPPEGAGFNASRDGALQKLPNMSPESSWFNTAMYPAVAKWKPQYRRGTLTAKSGDFGTVALDATYASATKNVGGITRIGINQGSTLTNVPIQYMSCNGNAFNVGDRVIVQFVGRDWIKPFIIGFVDNPRGCPPSPTNPPVITWPDFYFYHPLTWWGENIGDLVRIQMWNCGSLPASTNIYVTCPPLSYSSGGYSFAIGETTLTFTFSNSVADDIYYDWSAASILGINTSSSPPHNSLTAGRYRRNLSTETGYCGGLGYRYVGGRYFVADDLTTTIHADPVTVIVSYSHNGLTGSKSYYLLMDSRLGYSIKNYVSFRPVPG